MRVLFLQWLSPVDPLKQDCGESTEKMLEALLAVTVRQKTPQYFYIDRWNPRICDFYLGFHALLCFGWVNTFCQKHCSNSTYIAPGVRPCFRVCVCVEAWFRLWRQTESAELWPLEPSLITAFVQVGRPCPVEPSLPAPDCAARCSSLIHGVAELIMWRERQNRGLNWILRDPKGDLCWER